MAILAGQTITRAGLAPAFSAAAGGGDKFLNTGHQHLHVKNGSGAPITVTIATQQTVDGQAVADRAVAVPAGADRIIGRFPPIIYNDADGYTQLTYSASADLTLAVLRS